MFDIRLANLSDAKNLSILAETTSRDTFAPHNTVEDMNTHCHISYGESIQAKEIANKEYATFVVEQDKRLIAYAQMRWGKPPECVGSNNVGEIHRFYIDREWHGKGLAQELMVACLDKMKAYKIELVWLGVWENNARAISFYKKFNFREVGSHTFTMGSDPQIDIIMISRINKL